MGLLFLGKFPNSSEGFETIAREVEKRQAETDVETDVETNAMSIFLVLEPTGGYEQRFAHFAYDFFQNSDNDAAAAPGIVSNGDWSLPAGTYPYTTVIGIVAGNTVTLNGYNFTRNDTYTVRMGAYGTLAVGGEVVGTLNTNAGDSWSATFNIPASLAGASQIAIRFESQNSPYFSYNWFNNQNLP